MKIKQVLKALKEVGIDTSKSYIPCENHIKELNILLNSVFKDNHKEIGRQAVEITCDDGYLRGAENEGSWFFEWGLIVYPTS